MNTYAGRVILWIGNLKLTKEVDSNHLQDEQMTIGESSESRCKLLMIDKLENTREGLYYSLMMISIIIRFF